MSWSPLPEQYKDFRVFLKEAWEVLGLPTPTPAQYRIAYFLQNSENRRRGIRAFRGAGKSWISSVYVLYCLRSNPQYKVLVVSASKERADNYTTFTRQLMDKWDLLNCLIPTGDQRDSRISFDVRPAEPDHAPSVKSVGITGQLSGSRADEIIADDVEVSNNSETQNKREKLLRSIAEFESILKPGGRITFLGTPQTEDSIYTKLQQKGYTELIIPARYPKLSTVSQKYGDALDSSVYDRLVVNPELEGSPVDPKRFTDLDLEERESSIGRSTFALQFMLDTTLSDTFKYPLRLRDLIISDVDPDVAFEKYIHSNSSSELLRHVASVGLRGDYFYQAMKVIGEPREYTTSVMSIDPSGRGADETAYAIVKTLNSQLFVPPEGIGGLMGGYEPAVLHKLAITAKKHKVNKVIIESNFGDSMFTALLKPVLTKIHPVEIVDVRHSQQKELRIIDTLEPVLNSHKLVLDRSLIESDKVVADSVSDEKKLSYQFFYQMSRLTRDRGSLRHDDRLDALAIAVKHLIDTMSLDVDSQIRERELRDSEVMLKSLQLNHESVIMSMMGASTEQLEAMQGAKGKPFKYL